MCTGQMVQSQHLTTTQYIWVWHVFYATCNWPHALTCKLHCAVKYYGHGIQAKLYLTTVTPWSALNSQPSAKPYANFEGISLESVSCRFDSIAPGCCPSIILLSEYEKCSLLVKKGSLKQFYKQLKFAKFANVNKYPIKFCAIGILGSLWYYYF